jgi:hypothetical protein
MNKKKPNILKREREERKKSKRKTVKQRKMGKLNKNGNEKGKGIN